jgi:hypothetical protein
MTVIPYSIVVWGYLYFLFSVFCILVRNHVKHYRFSFSLISTFSKQSSLLYSIRILYWKTRWQNLFYLHWRDEVQRSFSLLFRSDTASAASHFSFFTAAMPVTFRGAMWIRARLMGIQFPNSCTTKSDALDWAACVLWPSHHNCVMWWDHTDY